MKLRFHPDVAAELGHLAEWYEERREGLGAELRDEVGRALAAVVEQPTRWPLSRQPKARALGVRHLVIARFPLAVEYTTRGAIVEVFAVAHMGRRPGYWLRRLELPKPNWPRHRR